jgi:hypothetical protein
MLSTSFLLAASMVVGQAEEAESTAPAGLAALKEFGELVVGEWTGKVVLDSAHPALGEPGDVLTGRGKVRWIWDNTGIEATWKLGATNGKWIAVASDTPGELRRVFAGTDGRVGTGTVAKMNGKWTSVDTAVLSDGAKRSQTLTLTVTDGGNKHIWDCTDVLVDGEKRPDTQDIWERAKKGTKKSSR